MKVKYYGEEIGTITTNRSMTVEEALYILGYDVNDADDCEKAYRDGFEPAYLDDMGYYQIDVESIELVY